MPADILIYAIIAAGLVFWLRNVLGTRHGGERERPNPLAPREASEKNKTAGEALVQGAGLLAELSDDLGANLERDMSIENKLAEQGLADIVRGDKGFDLPRFMRGAQDAFIFIIESFAAADKQALQGLLSDPVYKAFETVIDERGKNDEAASVEIHSIRKTEIIDAQIKDKMAFITVRFTADETSIVRDKDDKVIFGDPERVTETIDIWTFGRSLRSRDPAWLVFETSEAEDDEFAGSTVPETDKK